MPIPNYNSYDNKMRLESTNKNTHDDNTNIDSAFTVSYDDNSKIRTVKELEAKHNTIEVGKVVHEKRDRKYYIELKKIKWFIRQ